MRRSVLSDMAEIFLQHATRVHSEFFKGRPRRGGYNKKVYEE